MPSPLYLLDTNIILALVRDRQFGKFIQSTYGVMHQSDRPLLCIVSEGEIRSLAAQFGWGAVRMQALEQLLLDADVVDLSQPGLVQAYVEIELASLAHPPGAYVMGKNDLWIAATAKVTGATLLTTDRDFDHLHPAQIQRIWIDPASSLPAPPGP